MEMDSVPEYLKSTYEEMQHLWRIMNEVPMTYKERMQYELRYERLQKYYLDEIDSIEYYENKGRAEGLVKGEAIGMAKGEAMGRAEGRAEGEAIGEAKGERRNAINTAKKMKDHGSTPDFIAEMTGLSLDEIAAL